MSRFEILAQLLDYCSRERIFLIGREKRVLVVTSDPRYLLQRFKVDTKSTEMKIKT